MEKAIKSEELTVNNEWKKPPMGMLPIGWEIKNLEENLESLIDYRGKTPKKSEEGIPTLSARSVRMGYIEYSNAFKISKETYDKFMVRGFPKRGDVLLTTEAPLGCVAILDRDDVGLAQRLITLRGKVNILDNNYLGYYLTSKQGQHELLSRASGTTVQGIKRTEFSKINIILPPLQEQEKIASILKSLDDKIEVNNQMNQTLEEMAQAIFKEWFAEFNFPNADGVPYKDNGGEMVESELGMIPRGWRVEDVSNVCKVNASSYSKKDDWDYINYLDTSNITKNKIDTIQMMDCNSEKVPSRAKRKVKENTILYSTVRPNQLHYGIIKKPVENMIASTGFVTIDSKYEYIKNDFIYCWLTQENITTKLQVIAESSTTTYPSIKPGDIKDMKLVIGDEGTMKNISKKLDEMNLYIESLKLENETLVKTRDTLLPKLMSGEVRV